MLVYSHRFSKLLIICIGILTVGCDAFFLALKPALNKPLHAIWSLMHLGHFNEPLLVFGGAHSNIDALFSLKKYVSKHQIPAHNIFLLMILSPIADNPMRP